MTQPTPTRSHPDEVPDRVRLAAIHVATGQAHTDEHDIPAAAARRIAEATLTAIWPQINGHIREQVASEIDAAADRIVGHAELAMRGRCLGLRAGARIARGEQQ